MEQIPTERDYKIFFSVILIVIIIAAYSASSEYPTYHASEYMNDTTRYYDCLSLGCSKIVTLHDVWVDENGVFRHLT